MTTFVSLFSGFGLKTIGAMNAGWTPAGAIEFDPAIAEVYAQNVSTLVTVCRVEDSDPKPYIGIDALLMSPSCKRASVANANATESEEDTRAAQGCVNWIRVCRPRFVILENVGGYRHFAAFRLITDTLRECGYRVEYSLRDAADWGVPQNRRRLILRAVLGSCVPEWLPTHASPKKLARMHGDLFAPAPKSWNGWYAAIEDLLPECPGSQFADWQLVRLPAVLKESLLVEGNTNRTREPHVIPEQRPSMAIQAHHGRRPAHMPHAFLVGVQGEGGDLARTAEQPAPTTAANHSATKYRAHLSEIGRTVALTPRCLARLQTLPDSFALPKSAKLACTGIGNGVPPKFMEGACRSLNGGLK